MSDPMKERFIPAGAGNTSNRHHCKASCPVYPRWRGEHNSLHTQRLAVDGLSPLARGTRRRRLFYRRRIPVYPRWRGEHLYAKKRTINGHGLSPLARGTQQNPPPRIYCRRFIPAGAGNTFVAVCRRRLFTVYPRWRGEHTLLAAFPKALTGLSPLARGTLKAAAAVVSVARFIPAGAGNTYLPLLKQSHESVYPRWRGEHQGRKVAPPPTERFIPAAAGNTCLGVCGPACIPVYPRWRGEHQVLRQAGDAGTGLSPLARGTHRGRGLTQITGRFIPAGAGNTFYLMTDAI